jgi:ABC-type amino acid transport substrate-binding protein
LSAPVIQRIFSFFFLLIVGPAIAAESTWDSIHQRKSLRIGVVQAPPWFLKDPTTGKWSGFGYSVGKAMQYLNKVGLGEIFENGTPEEILVSPKKRRTKESLSGHDQFQIPSRHMT